MQPHLSVPQQRARTKASLEQVKYDLGQLQRLVGKPGRATDDLLRRIELRKGKLRDLQATMEQLEMETKMPTPIISRTMYTRCMQYDGTNAQEIIGTLKNALPEGHAFIYTPNVTPATFAYSRQDVIPGEKGYRDFADVIDPGSWVVMDIRGVVILTEERFHLFSR